ncbi:hypothetical protein R3W88_005973 [Solanum pinnatisectum]|uniref:Retrotransposon Copia-like N-terminal domain-containing protein n=1 Tax=Solanum pinnatisectum TaxID=50273 RepID=A0AAV9KDH0_9SOLN|nr:hypothetical protein R3W88_005973 [Solanum pinnatisectum]
MAELTVATLEHSHPLCLQASDMPGASLIATKLTGLENYGLWSRSLRLALLLIQRGFSNSMGKVQCCSVVLDKYPPPKQGTDYVTIYFLKLKDLWDELDMLVLSHLCSCDEAKPYIEHLSQQRLLMFLMGLNESYSHVRSGLLLKTVMPTVNQAYATVVQKGSQRLLGVVDINKEPFTMLVNRRQNFKGKKLLDVACDHCGYRIHLSKDCYRIFSYPADFKSKRKQLPAYPQGNTGAYPHPQGNTGYKTANTMQNTAHGVKSYANYVVNEGQGHGFQLIEEEFNHVRNMRHNTGTCLMSIPML